MCIGVGALTLRKSPAKANKGPATIYYGTLKANDAGSTPRVAAKHFDVATDNLHYRGVTNDNSRRRIDVRSRNIDDARVSIHNCPGRIDCAGLTAGEAIRSSRYAVAARAAPEELPIVAPGVHAERRTVYREPPSESGASSATCTVREPGAPAGPARRGATPGRRSIINQATLPVPHRSLWHPERSLRQPEPCRLPPQDSRCDRERALPRPRRGCLYYQTVV